MGLASTTGLRLPGGRSARIPVVLLVAMLLVQIVDVVGDALAGRESVLRELTQLGALPELVGAAVVMGLGALLARHEIVAPCTRWSRRIAGIAGILLCGLLAQELVAQVSHVGHGGDGGLLVHAAGTVVPLALAAGLASALLVGIAVVVGRVVSRARVALVVLLRPPTPRRYDTGRSVVLPPRGSARRRLPGRAPPVLAAR